MSSSLCGILNKNSSSNSQKNFFSMISPLKKYSNYKKVIISMGWLRFCFLYHQGYKKNIYKERGVIIVLDGYLLDVPSYYPNYAFYINFLFKKYGVSFVNKLNGVFNIIIYDKKTGLFLIFNDRFGLKPLFYYRDKNVLLFGSEVKSLIKYNHIRKEINWSAWTDYFSYRYILNDETFFKNIKKLSAGYYLKLDDNRLSINKNNFGMKKSFSRLSYKKQSNLLAITLKKSILHFANFRGKYLCPLSGGYDSRTIVFLMKKYLNKNFQTITVSNAKEKDDSLLGRLVSKQLKIKSLFIKKTDHPFQHFFLVKSYLLDGMINENMWMIPLNLRLNEFNNYFDGIGGDILLRGLFHPQKLKKYFNTEIFTNNWVQEFGFNLSFVKAYFKNNYQQKILTTNYKIKSVLNQIEKTEYKISEFILKTRTRNAISPAIFSIVGRKTDVFLFFLEKNLLEFSLLLPTQFKFSGIYIKTLKNLFADFATIPTTNDGSFIKTGRKFIKNILLKTGLYQSFNSLYKFVYLYKNTSGTLTNNDVLFINDLIGVLIYPSFIKENFFKKKVQKMNKKHFIDFFFLNILEFLVWYNLFYVDNEKIYFLLNKKRLK